MQPFSAMPGTQLPAALPWLRSVRIVIVLAFCASLLAYVVFSWHWPLIHDMQVMHYVSFLIDRGWAPYREIHDMNMPGAYLVEGWALHVFGSSDLGWRLYDFSLCAALIAGCIAIARRYDWLAGLVAGGTFVLIHASEGPMNAGQRDQVMATALIVGYAFCFASVRRGRPWLMLPFALAAALAAAVKPTLLPLGPVVLMLAALHLRRTKVRAPPYVLWASAGFAAIAALVLYFLFAHGSMRAFLHDLAILPHYASTGHASWAYLLRATLQVPVLVYVAIAVVLAVTGERWRNWEMPALWCGVLFGLVNFYGQHKGFGQHRYTTIAFVLLWASIQIFHSTRNPRPAARVAAWAALALIVLLYLPKNVRACRAQPRTSDETRALESDLRQLGTAQLQGNIQCLDIVDACLNALFHERIVQSTGATGDLLLFLPQTSPVVDDARNLFWTEVHEQPPEVYVLTNNVFGGERSFHLIDTWPQFAKYLDAEYVYVRQQEFGPCKRRPDPAHNPPYPAYRIYIRSGSPLLARMPPALNLQDAPGAEPECPR